MSILFSPVIRLMNILTIPKKFLVIGISVLISLLIVLVQLVTAHYADIQFSELEDEGVNYVVAVRKIMQPLQLHRGLTTAVLNGETSVKGKIDEQKSKLQEAISQLDRLDQGEGEKTPRNCIMDNRKSRNRTRFKCFN